MPISPAFAMTAHRAQGQTLENVIIDLQSCKGTEAPYVMASCARSLDGLLILRPFDRRKICCRESEDTCKEKQQSKILNLVTLLKFGNESEKQQAIQDLENLHLSEMNVAQIVPQSTKSPPTFTDAETTLQTFQNVIEECACISNTTSIPHHPKVMINLEDNNEEEEEDITVQPCPSLKRPFVIAIDSEPFPKGKRGRQSK